MIASIGKLFEYRIWQTEKLKHSDLDERALDALKEFPVDGALAVLKQFLESNLVTETFSPWNMRYLAAVIGACVQQVSLSLRSDEDVSSEDSLRWLRHQRRLITGTRAFPLSTYQNIACCLSNTITSTNIKNT